MPASHQASRHRRRFAGHLAGGAALAAFVVVLGSLGAASAAAARHQGPRAGGQGAAALAGRFGRGQKPGNDGGEGFRDVEGVVATLGTNSFTITRGRLATITVDVLTSTTFTEGGQPASFASLATGDRVKVAGTVASGALDAAKVLIAAGEQRHVEGVVATLGTNSFTITRGRLATITVDVLTSTAFTEGGQPATFKSLSIGDRVEVAGAVSSGTLDAAQVSIAKAPQLAVLGTVGTLGSGSFMLNVGGRGRALTVDVSSTVYLEAGLSSASFSNLAANDQVVVVGSRSGEGTLDATTVVILAS